MIYIVQRLVVQEPSMLNSLVYVIIGANLDPPYSLTSRENYNVQFATACKRSHKVAIKEQRPILCALLSQIHQFHGLIM